MRKTYPYLQNVYAPDLNVESAKRYFLTYLDDFVNQREYVKITLLDWEENPIKSIEGKIISGSISKDGSSAVRRTCNLSCAVDGNSYNSDNLKMDFSLNKKIFIELGVKNDSPYYKEYPILWFPQGVFFITSFSMNSSASSTVNLSLGLKDKMALLNGDIGGKFSSTVQFDMMTTQLSSGETKEQKVLIYNIIKELVNHYGKEDLNNIIIEDVPLRIRKIMRWIGSNPLYGVLIPATELGPEQWEFFLDRPASNYYTFEYGDDVGYIYEDFVVNSELIGAAGDSVCSILDQIKNILGNYEYFYDEMGIFHFREIKNFLNVTQGEFLLDEMSENDYLIETTNEKAVYAFEDNRNITSITITPQYENIKNDYIVHGLRQSDVSDITHEVMYHLVIDEKPEIRGVHQENGKTWSYYGGEDEYHFVVCYTDPEDGLNKLAIVDGLDYSDENKLVYAYNGYDKLPMVGNFNKFYYVKDSAADDNGIIINADKVYYWENDLYKELTFSTFEQDENGEEIEIKHSLGINSDYFYETYYPKDWRTFLYLKGLQAQNLGTDEGEYFAELAAFWPKSYNLLHNKQDWFVNRSGENESYSVLSKGDYFLDFIDTSADVGVYSVSAIGRRQDVCQEDDINCLFEPEIPNVIFLNIDNPSDNISENTTLNDDMGEDLSDDDLIDMAREYCDKNGHPYCQVREDIYSGLAIGGYSNSAYEKIRYELFCHTNFQKTVSLTSIPIYYLEPNSRVTINDKSTNTYGDFMVQNINLSFGPGANMSVTLNEIHERL